MMDDPSGPFEVQGMARQAVLVLPVLTSAGCWL